MDWLGLKGRNAIVTGGASGIGRACCEGLAEAGVNIMVADVNDDRRRETVRHLSETFGGKHSWVNVDVSSKESVDHMVETTISELGSIGILVNNAGINVPRLLVDPRGKQELTEDVWDRITAVNQKGLFLCTQAVARYLIRNNREGVIINMASEAGMEGSAGQSAYAGTKAAVYTLTRSWAKEIGVYGVRVVGVAPGIMEATPLRSEEYEKALAYTRNISVKELRAAYEKASIPIGRVGKLEEVANVVCFLASDRASYIHGTTINISGGKSRG